MEKSLLYSDQIGCFAGTVRDLAVARGMGTVGEIVKKAARFLAQADGAAFVIREGDVCYYADEDAVAALWKGKRFPVSDCICGWAVLNRETVVIRDVYKDERVNDEIYKPTFVKSLAVIPVKSSDPIAAIAVYWSYENEPDEKTLRLLQSMADITAVTIENIAVHDSLEQRVAERTKELEQVNRDLESFGYSIAHDLRAPLRAINGFLNVITEDHGSTLNEETHLYMNKVLKNASQMSLLIEGLLEFLRMGRKEIEKTLVPMQRMVQELCEEVKATEPARDIVFEISELPDAKADQILLKQVWQNLISNAVKYTSKKEKALIEIGYRQVNEAGAYFVRDNGAGFDVNYAHKLFGVFQRLHSQREFEGTGIGLAIVDKIITKHGGKIWAEGEVDKGAVFYFTLK